MYVFSPPLCSGLGSAVSSPSGVRGGAPENLDFGAFCDLRNHVPNSQLAFESGEGQQLNLGGGKCPLHQRRTAPGGEGEL